MSKVQGYPHMKDSQIEWVGPIPDTWTVFPAATVFSEIKERNSDGSRANPLSFRYGEIVAKNIVGDIDEDLKETLSAYRVVSPDTIMINGLNLNYDFITQRVAIVNQHGIITSAYIAVRPDESKLLPRFALYLLKAYDYRQVFHGIGSGIRKTLKYADLRQVEMVTPPIDTQKQVVHFLDSTCGDIDTAITETKASVEEYKLLRQSVITQAVTKGLDPNVPMKDSGVDVIGEMPCGWELRRQRFLCKTTTGDQNTQDSIEDGEYPFYVRSPIIQRSHCCSYDGEGVLMAGDGAGAGRIFHYAQGKYAIHQRVYCFHDFADINPRFFFHLMSAIFPFEMDKGSAKSTVPSVRLPMLLNFMVPLPTMSEQAGIVSYLDPTCHDIDSLISEKESMICDLESYKKSLIYEVVTGKRRVA